MWPRDQCSSHLRFHFLFFSLVYSENRRYRLAGQATLPCSGDTHVNGRTPPTPSPSSATPPHTWSLSRKALTKAPGLISLEGVWYEATEGGPK